MKKDHLDLEAVLNIGKVISIKGRYIDVLVDKTKNSSHLLFNGEIIKNVSVGSYVKITKGFEELIGKIDGEFIVEDKNAIGVKCGDKIFNSDDIIISTPVQDMFNFFWYILTS